MSALPHRAQAAAVIAANPDLAAACEDRAQRSRSAGRWRAMRPRTDQQAWADFEAAEVADDVRKVMHQ